MTLPSEVQHVAQSFPVAGRRAFLGLLSLSGIWLALPSQSPSTGFVAAWVIQMVLACVLMLTPGLGRGRLCFKRQAWHWESVHMGAVRVQVTPVFDLAGLLCLRLSPTSAMAGRGWNGPAWVWLLEADPKAWMDLRLALHCVDVKEGP